MTTTNPTDSPFGINAHVPDTQQIDLISKAGIKWIRLDFNWNSIESSKGKYQFGPLKNAVSTAKNKGLNIYGSLAYSPAWANGGNQDRRYPPANPADWQTFVKRAASEFKGSIKHWGMWNEPNLQHFFIGSIQQYTDLILKPGSVAAKGADPSCQVVAPDIICTNEGKWWEWIKEVVKRAGKDSFDVFSCHIYKNEGAKQVIDMLEKGEWWAPFFVRWFVPSAKSIRQVMKECKIDNKPLWLTEVGWYTADGDEPVSEDTQAKYYTQLCADVLERSDWLKKVFFYELKDDPNPTIEKWGVLKANNQAKPAYTAYKDAVAKA